MNDDLLKSADKFYADSINEARLAKLKSGYIDIIFILVIFNQEGRVALLGKHLPKISLRLWTGELLDDQELMGRLILERLEVLGGLFDVEVFGYGPDNTILVSGNVTSTPPYMHFVHYSEVNGYSYDVVRKALGETAAAEGWLSIIYGEK